jgi:transglutaminase-like putative cysteine protease
LKPHLSSHRSPASLRRPAIALVVALAATLAASAAFAVAAPEYTVGPEPAWVQRVDDPAPAPAARGTVPGGARWWLADEQVRLEGDPPQDYHRTVVEVVSDHGLDTASQHDIEFDPTYERVTLHDVRVTRDGRATSRLASARIKVLQRETDLDSQVYDGRKTLSIALPDIRRGDVVEWSWTLSGRNPVFGGHRFGDSEMQWTAPVLHLHRRLLAPAGATLHVAALGAGAAAVTSERGALSETVWDRRDVPALHPDQDTPPGYDPYASVQWTDFDTWGDVARWALPLYTPPSTLGPALAAERDRIAAAHADAAGRVVAVLRLVQAEVRYLGVEIGANSHAPRPPDEVFARRYGDCKEKALLMVTLLRSMGIDAVPVLVHTRRRDRIDQLLPSPYAFNHVITRVRAAGGTYWLDPTRLPQGGDLAHLYQPDYRLGLPVEATATTLATLPVPAPDGRRREVAAVLDASHGPSKPATLEVTTSYRGLAADNERDLLEDEDHDELQRRYAEFYAKRYPGLKAAAPFDVKEGDPAANVLTVTEHYTIARFWRRGSDQRVSVTAADLDELLKRPEHPVRRSPLTLGGPESMRVALTLKLPGYWPVQAVAARDEVVDPAFKLTRQVEPRGDDVTLTWDYARVATEIPAAAAGTYDEHMAEARDLLDHAIEAPRPSLGAWYGTPWEWAAGMVGLGIALWGWRSSRTRAVRTGSSIPPGPRAREPG